MSDKVQGWAWDLDLPPTRKLVLLWLAGRATDNGVAFPGEREIREHTGLGERMVRYHLQWLASDRDDNGEPKRPLIMRVERRIASQRNTSNVYVLAVPWQQPEAVRRDLEELQHVTHAAIEHALAQLGATDCPQGSGGNGLPRVGEVDCPEVGATGCPQERSRTKRHRDTPLPPTGDQPQGGMSEFPGAGAGLAEAHAEARARELVQAFQRGLGAEELAATPAMQRRDLAIARQLAVAGATPAEAAAFAREMSALPGRLAPVDLRAFERERLSWLARRRVGTTGMRRLVDRTGRPPSWLEPSSEAPPAASKPPMVTQASLLDGEALAASLGAALGLAVGDQGGSR